MNQMEQDTELFNTRVGQALDRRGDANWLT